MTRSPAPQMDDEDDNAIWWNSLLAQGVALRDVYVVEHAVANGAVETDAVEGDWNEVLEDTIFLDQLEVVAHALNKGADPHLLDSHGYTALEVAAKDGNVPLLKVLLENKADPRKGGCVFSGALEAVAHAEEDDRKTALVCAQLLLDAGANIDQSRVGCDCDLWQCCSRTKVRDNAWTASRSQNFPEYTDFLREKGARQFLTS